jgi:uncharacterized protein
MRSRFFPLLSGLAAFVVIWVLGFAPQFLLYAHVSRIIVFFLEGGVTAAGFIAYVRLIEKREPSELSAWRWGLLPLGTLIGSGFFALLIGMLAVSGHDRFESFELPSRFFSAIVFALGTAIWEEVTFRGLLSRSIERTGGTWVGVAVSALVFGAVHGLNPNASLRASAAIVVESGLMLAFAYVAARTLWLPIGSHFGWNFTEDYLFGVRISGHAARPAVFTGSLLGTATFTGGEYGVEGALPSVILGGIVAAIFIYLAYRRRELVPLRGA